ncbi:tetratricopeptide repeat protein [Rhodobacter capsulatus]|uniref:tetratricopeptide repeat protein n=1 Tax=Rhodobacter capsulatus TaxID=1061 RepID=UPI00402595BB
MALYRAWLLQHGQKGDSAAAWYNLGVALQRMGKHAEATAALETAQRLRPGLWQAGLGRGLAFEAAGAPDSALSVWRELLPPPPRRDGRSTSRLARLLEDRGRLGEAIEEARAALLIDPDQPDVIQHLVHNRQRTTTWPVTEVAVPGISEEPGGAACGPSRGAGAGRRSGAAGRDLRQLDRPQTARGTAASGACGRLCP